MKSKNRVLFLSLVACGSLVASPGTAVKRAGATPRLTSPEVAASVAAPKAPAIEPQAKVVQYGEKDVVKVNTKVRFTTLIALPKNEQILVKRPDMAKVVNLNVDPKDYWLYTSSPYDRERRRQAFERYGFEEGLEILAQSGLAQSGLARSNK